MFPTEQMFRTFGTKRSQHLRKLRSDTGAPSSPPPPLGLLQPSQLPSLPIFYHHHPCFLSRPNSTISKPHWFVSFLNSLFWIIHPFENLMKATNFSPQGICISIHACTLTCINVHTYAPFPQHTHINHTLLSIFILVFRYTIQIFLSNNFADFQE